MRVKRGLVSRRKHNKLLKLAEGYRGSRSKLVRTAKAATLQAGQYAFQGRKKRKSDFRTLWITRISEAAKTQDISYSKLLKQLKTAQITLNRKMLADLVLNDQKTFIHIVEVAKKA